MRTTIDIDEELIADTVAESGKRTKKAAIEEALREYVSLQRRKKLAERIRMGDLGIDLSIEDLERLRGRRIG